MFDPHLAKRRYVDEAQDERSAVAAFTVVEDLVFTLVASARPVDKYIFKFHQPGQVFAHGEIAPAQGFSHFTLFETEFLAWFILLF